MKEEHFLLVICHRQDRFISLMEAVGLVKPIGFHEIINPLTDKVEGYSEKCTMNNHVAKIINRINYAMLDDEGESAAKRLEACGLIKCHWK